MEFNGLVPGCPVFPAAAPAFSAARRGGKPGSGAPAGRPRGVLRRGRPAGRAAGSRGRKRGNRRSDPPPRGRSGPVAWKQRPPGIRRKTESVPARSASPATAAAPDCPGLGRIHRNRFRLYYGFAGREADGARRPPRGRAHISLGARPAAARIYKVRTAGRSVRTGRRRDRQRCWPQPAPPPPRPPRARDARSAPWSGSSNARAACRSSSGPRRAPARGSRSCA